MAVKVLVVDDSSFFRRRLSEILEQDISITVIDTACNGKEAVEKVKQLKPDVVTMDIEMPVMDGITAVRQIMAAQPTPILMFSSLTHDGARATLDALDAGALDFLPKKFEDIAKDKNEAVKLLQDRVKTIARQRVSRIVSRVNSPSTTTPLRASVATRPSRLAPAPTSRNVTSSSASRVSPSLQQNAVPATSNRAADSSSSRSANNATPRSNTYKSSGKAYQLLAIGTSTGGPVALQAVLNKIPASFPYPILIIQHMPGSFTPAFAGRLNSLCNISVKEAVTGDALRPGWAYLAPGGKQMVVEGQYNNARLRIIDSNDPKVNYKPCVDITFASLSKIFRNKVLAVVLTGMGADGRDGSKMLKLNGSTIWAQDEDSCVVYGMPQAVTKSGLASEEFALNDMADSILIEMK